MELFEYIKSQLPQMPNSAIMKQLGASEELIDYVKETPWNTNWNVIGSIASSGGGGDTGEVWLVGDTGTEYQGMKIFQLSNAGDTDHMAELVANGENYTVFLDGVELSYYNKQPSDSDYVAVDWTDTDDYSTMTKQVAVYLESGETSAQATYKDGSTAPTSVEVSVKAK